MAENPLYLMCFSSDIWENTDMSTAVLGSVPRHKISLACWRLSWHLGYLGYPYSRATGTFSCFLWQGFADFCTQFTVLTVPWGLLGWQLFPKPSHFLLYLSTHAFLNTFCPLLCPNYRGGAPFPVANFWWLFSSRSLMLSDRLAAY